MGAATWLSDKWNAYLDFDLGARLADRRAKAAEDLDEVFDNTCKQRLEVLRQNRVNLNYGLRHADKRPYSSTPD